MKSKRAMWIMAVVAIAGCGGERAAPSSAAPNGSDAEALGPAVMLSVRVQTVDDATYYVGSFPELPTGTLDLSRMREFSGADASAYDGHVFVSNEEDGTLTRFDVSTDHRLVDGPRISFASHGATGYLPPAFISPTRAYVMSPQLDVIIVWNPTAMEVVGTIPVALPELSANTPALDGRPVRVGDYIAWDINAVDWDALDYHAEATLVLAPINGDPPLLLRDARCNFGTFNFIDDRGDLYFFGTEYRGYLRQYGTTAGTAPPDCVLRVKAGEAQFDPDFFVDLAQVTGSPAVHGMWRIRERLWMTMVWPPAQAFPTIPDDLWDATLTPMLLDLDARMAVPFPAIAAAPAGNVRTLELDGRAYYQIYNADRSRVQFGTLSESGFSEVLNTTGDVLGIGRVR